MVNSQYFSTSSASLKKKFILRSSCHVRPLKATCPTVLQSTLASQLALTLCRMHGLGICMQWMDMRAFSFSFRTAYTPKMHEHYKDFHPPYVMATSPPSWVLRKFRHLPETGTLASNDGLRQVFHLLDKVSGNSCASTYKKVRATQW